MTAPRRRSVAAVLATACGVLAAALPSAGSAAAVRGEPVTATLAATTSVGVGLREFRISLYRTTVKRGTVKLNIHNYGEDDHDLVVQRAGKSYGTMPALRSDGSTTLRVRLRKRGTYTLICTTADHASRGMITRIKVR